MRACLRIMMPAAMCKLKKARGWEMGMGSPLKPTSKLENNLNVEVWSVGLLLIYSYAILRLLLLQALYGHYSYPGTENKPFFSFSILQRTNSSSELVVDPEMLHVISSPDAEG